MTLSEAPSGLAAPIADSAAAGALADARDARARLRGGEDVARGLVDQRGDDRTALLELRLAGQQFVNLALEGVLIEQLPAGHAVEFGARLGEAILVGVLHFGLTGGQGAEHVVVKGDIKHCRAAPQQRDRDTPQSATITRTDAAATVRIFSPLAREKK